VAVLAGWMVTEIGRQPWLVHGVLTTAEAASAVPAGSIAISFVAYAVVYTVLLVSFMVVVTQLAIKDALGEQAPTAAPPELAQALAAGR
jgi:cytochrome d ubiquinol oxidase subunit I